MNKAGMCWHITSGQGHSCQDRVAPQEHFIRSCPNSRNVFWDRSGFYFFLLSRKQGPACASGPDEIREYYRMYRPSPLCHAYRREKCKKIAFWSCISHRIRVYSSLHLKRNLFAIYSNEVTSAAEQQIGEVRKMRLAKRLAFFHFDFSFGV